MSGEHWSCQTSEVLLCGNQQSNVIDKQPLSFILFITKRTRSIQSHKWKRINLYIRDFLFET